MSLYSCDKESSPISTQVAEENYEFIDIFCFCGIVNDGRPLLGLYGLGMEVPGWLWLSCLFFLWLENAG